MVKMKCQMHRKFVNLKEMRRHRKHLNLGCWLWYQAVVKMTTTWMPYSFSTKKQMLVFGVLFLQPADKFGFVCFGIFLFCFCLVQGEKVPDAQDFGWQSKGEDHFKSWFPFFSYFLVTIQILSSLKASLYISFVFFRSSIENFFLLFSSDLWSGTFSFVFFRSLIGNFFLLFLFFFVFFRERGWTFSSWVKVYGELGFWLKRLVKWSDMMYARVLVWPMI